MRPDLLVCHGCQSIGPDKISLFTVEREGDELVCRQCGRRYPIRDDLAVMTEVEAQADAEVREHVSTYMDAHWGAGYDRGARAFVQRLEALAPVKLAVELGCSAGRTLAALAARAEHAVGVELQAGTLSLASRLFAGSAVEWERRVVGDHYETVRTPPHALGNVTLALDDVLDPPLVPGAYDRVVALNMLDSVRVPGQLLSVIDALCAPGGEIIVSSPYAWHATVTADHRLGGGDPASYLRERLRSGHDLRARYHVADEAEIPWVLRRDARSEVSYRVDYIRAVKASA